MSLLEAPIEMLTDALSPRDLHINHTFGSSVDVAGLLREARVPYSAAYMSKCGVGMCGRCAASQYGGNYRCPSCGRTLNPKFSGYNTECACGAIVIRCTAGLICATTVPIRGHQETEDII